MSRLAALIDQAADSTRPLSDVLRQVKIVASRIGDRELAKWASDELNGYGPDDELPPYRAERGFPVQGDWSGPAGSRITNAEISPVGITDDFIGWFSTSLRQPVADLELLSSGTHDPVLRWDPWAVVEYNRRASSGEGGARMRMMSLVDARLMIPRNTLRGILDSIRTRVLDFALALEGVAPDAGEPNGPTVADSRVERVTQNFHITVNGDGNNIATGDNARQRVKVRKGDAEALLQAARALGLSADDAIQFRDAVIADNGTVGESTQNFVTRVRSGAVSLAGNVLANVAATGLLEAAGQFVGG